MGKKRSFLTFTVFAGYFLVAALAGFAVWFIYDQVIDYSRMTTRNQTGNRKLFLVSEATTKLYEAESLSRQLIQTGDIENFGIYTSKIDTITRTLDSLQTLEIENSVDEEIDSITMLLTRKTSNLQELLQLRAKGETESYYSRVLNELERADENFEDPRYEQRFRDLEPHQRRLLIQLLEYAEAEKPEPDGVTVDSIVNVVKTVLGQLETQERRYRRALRDQENALLSNEIQLNNRLRTLLSAIEAEEREISLQQVSAWQNTVEQTSKIMGFLGAASLIVIVIFIFLVVKDVSRSQRFRKELENAKTYAESLLKSREQFMNTVTHDLRSPLNAVVGYTGLLENTELNKSQNRYLQQLKKSSDYLLHLVNDLLDLSRLEAGKMSIDELAFNPKNLITETVENAIPPNKPQELLVRTEVSDELDQLIISDPFRIKQILTNLVTNACKFTEKGSVKIKGWLEGPKEFPVLKIKVSDTGIGISDSQKEKVFEEFSQEDSSIEKKYGGTGLGLAISKKLTDLLQGEISLESELGKGSTFLLEIPVKIAENVANASAEDSPKIPNPSQFSILIVDDEPAQLGLLKEFIRSTGMSFQTAENGKEALEKIRSEKIDLVLTDIQMPKMDGFQLLREIQKDPNIPGLPVIALSGQSNISPEDYLKKGFSGSLLKPYSSKALLQIIEDLLKIKIQKEESPLLDTSSDKFYSLTDIKAFAGEDQQALNAILSAFIESTRANLQALQLSIQKGQFEKVSSVAHKMLPMFRQLKTEHLIAQLHIFETAPPADVQQVDIHLFSREVNKLLQHLEQEIKD